MAESGRRRTTRNRVCRKAPWVRIPLSPPENRKGEPITAGFAPFSSHHPDLGGVERSAYSLYNKRVTERCSSGMERWLSWSKALAWKASNGVKPFEGSNPSLSATKIKFGRARRGGSGALNPQSAIAGFNSCPRPRIFGASAG